MRIFNELFFSQILQFKANTIEICDLTKLKFKSSYLLPNGACRYLLLIRTNGFMAILFERLVKNLLQALGFLLY